jgi:hypothetical protein
MKIDLAAAAAKGIGKPARQFRREIAVIGGNQPGDRNPRGFAEQRGCGEQRLRRADLTRRVIGMAAAAGGKGDDGRDNVRALMRQRQRAPAAGRMADDDRAVLTDKRLARMNSCAKAIWAAVARAARA